MYYLKQINNLIFILDSMRCGHVEKLCIIILPLQGLLVETIFCSCKQVQVKYQFFELSEPD